MDSETFCHERLGMSKGEKVGMIPQEKTNLWGGSLALGHPFAATGIRLIMQAVDRMKSEDKETALVSSCGVSGQGYAFFLERYD